MAKFQNDERVITRLGEMIVVNSYTDDEGTCYVLAFITKKGEANQKRNHRFFFEEGIQKKEVTNG